MPGWAPEVPVICLTLRAAYWTRPALLTFCRDIISQEHSLHSVIKGYEMPHILPWNDQAVRKYGVSEGISVPPPSTAKTEVLPLPSVWACGWQSCLISGWLPERCWHRLTGLMKRLKFISLKKFFFHSPSFWVLCKHLLILSNGFPKAIFTQVYILIISTLCYCHCSPPLLLVPTLILKFPSSYGVQFLFLCFGDSTSLIRVTYRIMGDGLFIGAWATYPW